MLSWMLLLPPNCVEIEIEELDMARLAKESANPFGPGAVPLTASAVSVSGVVA